MTSKHSRQTLVVAAFAAIYLIWGSTYLAIQMAIESIPPLLMAGFRFLFSGLAVLALFRMRGRIACSWNDWRDAALVGALLLVGGNGGVTFGEQWLPSSTAALLIATVPLWIAVLGWVTGISTKPTPLGWTGLFMGVFGVGILFNPFHNQAGSSAARGFYSLMIAAFTWSAGSLYSRKAHSNLPTFLKVAMQMICGGLMLVAFGGAIGEFERLKLGSITHRSLGAFLYLILFGSWIGFTAYVWLLKACHPAQVATYAFVNPVVAVFLGWSIAGERLSPRMLTGAAVIIYAVAIVVVGGIQASSPQNPRHAQKEGEPGALEIT